jgi:hypothetical protein
MLPLLYVAVLNSLANRFMLAMAAGVCTCQALHHNPWTLGSYAATDNITGECDAVGHGWWEQHARTHDGAAMLKPQKRIQAQQNCR